jgi:hypothetical protein
MVDRHPLIVVPRRPSTELGPSPTRHRDPLRPLAAPFHASVAVEVFAAPRVRLGEVLRGA